jgi:tetratricopeptide (TPR) repeat protein
MFELETMMSLSEELLGIDPHDIGGTDAKGAFARALVSHCENNDGLGALADAIRLRGLPTEPPPAPSKDEGELDPGTLVGDFRVLKRAAQGPLATIYLAERAAPSNGHTERAALKVFRPEHTKNKGAAWRLLTTARALRKVRDQGLANIYEAGTLADGRVYIASEYISGQTLAARISRTGPVHFNELRPVIRTVLKGLGALHAQGMLHGHLKADNIFLVRPTTPDEKSAHSYGVLSDLATARLLEISEDQLPGVFRLVGDPQTMAPEVARGDAASPRSEVYAMACLLYHAVTGRPPFEGANAIEQISAHLFEEPEPPSLIAPANSLPKELDDVLLRALSKVPEERYENAAEFAEAIEAAASISAPAEEVHALEMPVLFSAIAAFQENPEDDTLVAQLEALVAPTKEWQHVVDAFLEATDALEDADAKKHLLFRTARILADEMGDRQGAERVYRVVLEIDPSDPQAHNAIEELYRGAGDHEALVGLLLDRLDSEVETEARANILREVAQLYEDELDQADNALIAYVQALAEAPEDDRTVRGVERLATTDEHWSDTITLLNEAIEQSDSSDKAVRLCVVVAGFYVRCIDRPDVALPYLSRALAIDPGNEPALEAMTSLYRAAQSHQELVQLLNHRADTATNPSRARDLRAEAAEVVYTKLQDVALAEQMFAAVFAEDVAHPGAVSALQKIYASEGSWDRLAELLTKTAKEQRGKDRVATLCELAEIYEDRLSDIEQAEGALEDAIAIDEASSSALKGLERIYAMRGEHERLLENLQKQLSLATTPAQRIALLERMGTTFEENAQDTAKAAEYFERIIELAPGHEGANTALARLYRVLHRFDDLAQTLDRHAKSSDDPTRKAELLMQAARVLMADVGSPERAQFVCERVLSIVPEHQEALSLTARIRAAAGDTVAALDALELLADTEQDADKRADLWVRAGQTLEDSEDLDNAIDRYKLAIDASANHEPALEALARLYERRGDSRGQAELLLRKVELALDPGTRAERLVALGKLRLDKLKDKALATDAFERALELDPTNLDALLGMGELAIERERWEDAAAYLEPLLDRTTELPGNVAREVCLNAGDAFRHLERYKEAERAYLQAKGIDPEHLEALRRLAKLASDNAKYDEAVETFLELLKRTDASGTQAERGQLLVSLGHAQQNAGRLHDAAASFADASEILVDDKDVLDALCEVQEALENWQAVARTLRRRLDLAEDEREKFTLWVKSGDVYAQRLGDREKAAKSYVAALELDADDRNVLSKLMAAYSESKDWSRLVEVLVRMAAVVDDPKLQGKYYATAGAVSLGELGVLEQAADHFERALSYDPTLDNAFRSLVECLTRLTAWDRLARVSRSFIESSKARVTDEQLASLWDNLGELYHYRLNRIAEAVEAYEAAQKLDPENRARTERLVEIYGKQPSAYANRAILKHAELLAQNPYRVESYKALRKLYTQLSRPDEAWAVCQALRSLNMAEPDEEAFFKRHRIQAPATARECITEELWSDYLVHDDQDMLLTAIFAAMQPAAVSELAQPPTSFGITRSGQLNCESAQAVLAQMLYYASGVTLIQLPPVFYRENDSGGVSFLFTQPPALGLGQAAFQQAPDQALAFIAGQKLSYMRPGHYMRQLVPTGSGLRAWLLAAIRLANPRFPVPETMREQVERNRNALGTTLTVPQQQVLTSMIEKLLQEQPELDMKRWALGVDLTADRIGFVLANSLDASVAVIRASSSDGSYASERDRLKELYRFAVSPQYLTLRRTIGVTIL